MKKLILLTGLLTILLTTGLRAQFYVYGDLIVYGDGDFSKNVTIDSTVTAMFLIVDSIKIGDSTITGTYQGILANTDYVDQQVSSVESYNRDSVYQYEQDSSIARQTMLYNRDSVSQYENDSSLARQSMLYNRDSVLAYEVDSGLARLTDITSYTFDEGLTETAGDVDLGGIYSSVTLNGSGSSNFTINAETTYNDGMYTGFAGGSSVKTAFQNTTSGGDPVYLIINDEDDQSICMRQGTDTDGEVVFSDLGLSYGGDISSRNTSNDRWLPDKGYVDGKVVSYTFDNGLTETAGDVDLGDFTAHVDIDGNGYNYLFETLNTGYGGGFQFYPTTPLARFYMEISGGSRKEIEFAYTSGGMTVTDNIDNMGWIYNADYSANSTARWCTDRAYVDSYYSGSLTDGAPTDAELDAAIGSTPSGVGANRKFLVKDTDGTGLYYDVISDGSNWIYFPGKSGSTAT